MDRQECLSYNCGRDSSSASQNTNRPCKKEFLQVSRIEGNVEIGGKLLRIERAACKIAATNIERRNYALAVICFDHDRFRRLVFLDVHFAEAHAAFFQEILRAPRYFLATWTRIRARWSATVARSQSMLLSPEARRF